MKPKVLVVLRKRDPVQQLATHAYFQRMWAPHEARSFQLSNPLGGGGGLGIPSCPQSSGSNPLIFKAATQQHALRRHDQAKLERLACIAQLQPHN